MKVLHIMNELRPSGAEVMLESAGPIWKQHGCELHVAAISPEPGPFADRLRAAGWQVSAIDPTGGTWKLMRKVTDVVRAISPDVVHLHQEGKSLPLCRAVHRTGLPTFRTVHNNFPFTGLLRIQKSFERWLCRQMGSRHIAISAAVQQNELQRFGNPTELCWNWFHADACRPPTSQERISARQRLGIPEDQQVIVSIGNGSDTKNYRVIVEALAIVGNSRLHYYQVGNAHPEGTDAATAKLLKVDSHVHFKGPSDQVLDWLWACDLYLMPSLFEGLSLAAIEALASGCECIFSDCPGLTDFKDMGMNASWMPADASNFASAINAGLSSGRDDSRGVQNSEQIRSRFSKEAGCQAYLTHWKSAVASN